MIGLWARSTEVACAAAAASLDGAGADFSQAFAYEGGMCGTSSTPRLLSNGTYRPIHDAVLGFEHCMVAKRRILDAPRYLAQVKTDCL